MGHPLIPFTSGRTSNPVNILALGNAPLILKAKAAKLGTYLYLRLIFIFFSIGIPKPIPPGKKGSTGGISIILEIALELIDDAELLLLEDKLDKKLADDAELLLIEDNDDADELDIELAEELSDDIEELNELLNDDIDG